MRRQGRKLSFCYHEAGHAYARWYFGHLIDRAFVLTAEQMVAGDFPEDRWGRRSECAGRVEGYDIQRQTPMPLPADLDPMERGRLQQLALISAEIALIESQAGMTAEALYTKQSLSSCAMDGGEQDIEKMRRLLDGWFLPGERRPMELLTERRTSAMMRSQPGWEAITSVARELHRVGELDGTAIAELCRKAFGGRAARYGSWDNHWPPTLAQLRNGFVPD